jgi:hypothetical protein
MVMRGAKLNGAGVNADNEEEPAIKFNVGLMSLDPLPLALDEMESENSDGTTLVRSDLEPWALIP